MTGPPFESIDELHGYGPGLARISFYSRDDEQGRASPAPATCYVSHLKNTGLKRPLWGFEWTVVLMMPTT